MKTAVVLVSEPHVRDNLRECLRRFGYASFAPPTVEDLAFAVQFKVPEVLVIEWNLPDMDTGRIVLALNADVRDAPRHTVLLKEPETPDAPPRVRSCVDVCFPKPLNFIEFIAYLRTLGDNPRQDGDSDRGGGPDKDDGSGRGARIKPVPPSREGKQAEPIPEPCDAALFAGTASAGGLTALW